MCAPAGPPVTFAPVDPKPDEREILRDVLDVGSDLPNTSSRA